MSQVTVNPGPGYVRYVMVESPMEHDEFKKLYRRLGRLGVMVPMAEMVNCAMTGLNVLDTQAGTQWTDQASKPEYWRSLGEIDQINHQLHRSFQQVKPSFPFAYKVVEYCDGLMVLEVRALVDWNQLNRFDVAV